MSCWRRSWDDSFKCRPFRFYTLPRTRFNGIWFLTMVLPSRKLAITKLILSFQNYEQKKLKKGCNHHHGFINYVKWFFFTFFSIWCDVSNFLPFLALLHFYVLKNIFVKKFPSGQWAVYFIFPICCLLLQLIKVKNSIRVKMSSWRFLFFVNSFPMFVFKIQITSQCRLHMVEHSWFAFENRW